MPIVGLLFTHMWAQHFDGSHSVSKTMQVPSMSASCEATLISHWGYTDDYYSASDAFITQIISANGVEEFPKENLTSSGLRHIIFREKVTSVTFKVAAYKSKAMGHGLVHLWQ